MIINFASLGQSGGGSGSGSTVSWSQTLTGGTKIAQITIDGVPQNVFAPEGGSGSGSSVSYSQTLSAGTEIGQITIDGSATTIYAPEGDSGSSVSYSQTLSAGTEIGQITIDGSATTIYAPAGGGSQGPTVIDLDSLSQAELIDLYNTLSGATSADKVNQSYEFYASFVNGSHYYRIQFCNAYWGDHICFGAVVPSAGHNDFVNIYECNVDNNGGVSKTENMYQLQELDRWGRLYSFYVSEDSGGTLTMPEGVPDNIRGAIGTVAWYGRGEGYYNGADFLHHFNTLVISEDSNKVIAIAPVNIYAANGIEIDANNFGAVFDYTDKSGNSWRVKFTWDGTNATIVSKTAI